MVQAKEDNKRYTNLSSFATLKDAEIVKKLVERRPKTKARILDRQTKKYYM